MRRVLRLKFRRPIGPGATLELSLTRPEGTRVEFVIRDGGEMCSSGSIGFAS